MTETPERRALPSRAQRILATVSLLVALLACPGCSQQACAGPARLPPSVFVHADILLADNPGTRVKVCATDCINFTRGEDNGQLGAQLVIADGDDSNPIDLHGTVEEPRQRAVDSILTVLLTKKTTTGICGSYVSYATDVHLDSIGNLQHGPS